MHIVIPVVVIAVLITLMFIKIRAQRKLLEEAKNYETLLRDARVIRWQYYQALQRSRDIIKDIEHLTSSLNTLKAELVSNCSEIREQIKLIRKEIGDSSESEFDVRVITQMKAAFSERWKYHNSRKILYNDTLKRLEEMRDKGEEIFHTEAAARDKWTQGKEEVMKLYQELKPRIKVTDPHTFFR